MNFSLFLHKSRLAFCVNLEQIICVVGYRCFQKQQNIKNFQKTCFREDFENDDETHEGL